MLCVPGQAHAGPLVCLGAAQSSRSGCRAVAAPPLGEGAALPLGLAIVGVHHAAAPEHLAQPLGREGGLLAPVGAARSTGIGATQPCTVRPTEARFGSLASGILALTPGPATPSGAVAGLEAASSAPPPAPRTPWQTLRIPTGPSVPCGGGRYAGAESSRKGQLQSRRT